MQDAQIGLYDMVLSTTLESNKSLAGLPPGPTPKKDPLFRGEKMFAARAKPNPANPETRHKGLSSSPDFHELIGLFRVLHCGQQPTARGLTP